MATAINRIDLLVHPFYHTPIVEATKTAYSEAQGKKLLEIWKGHVDEVAKDRSRLLLMVSAPFKLAWQMKLFKELTAYTERRLGKRLGLFRELHKGHPISNYKRTGYKTFQAFAGNNGFKVDALKVKTRGFGEYTDQCVVDFLIGLNRFVGLQNVIPYRNRQSALIARKSVGWALKPWEIPKLLETAEGREKLRRKARRYARRRRLKANLAADLERKLGKMKFTGKNLFKPRTHLMKKRPMA